MRLSTLLWRERWWVVGLIALATCVRIPTVDGWDDAFYVGQLLSIVGDHDLRLQDDVVLVPRLAAEKHRILVTLTDSGALANTFSVGPAVLWAPFAAPALTVASPPKWQPFRAAAAVAAMVMLACTALLSVSVVRRFGVSSDMAALASGVAILCGPLAVYGTRAYLNAHLGSALLVALAIHQGMCWVESRSRHSAILFGLAFGLACVNRWQDVVVVAPFGAAVLAQSHTNPRARWSGLTIAACCAAMAGALQPLAWMAQFGRPVLMPQGGGYMHWGAPHVGALLFSTYHGLVPWTPGFAIGLLMPIIVLARYRQTATSRLAYLVGFAIATVLAVYVSACPDDWWGRAAFGARRLTSLTIPAAAGLGLLLQRTSKRTRILLAASLGGWAVVAVSAHLSHFEDVGLLLVGRPGPYQPSGIEAVRPDSWASSWGPVQFAVPGFSLSDLPRPLDHAVGIALVVAVVVCVRLFSGVLRRSGRAQRTLTAVAVVYVLGWMGALALCPSNAQWNIVWRNFVEAPLDRQRSECLPPEMGVARDVVIAFRARRDGDKAALQGALAGLAALEMSGDDVK